MKKLSVYSNIASILIHFILGVLLLYEIALLVFLKWGISDASYLVYIMVYHVFFLPLCLLCAEYDFERYKKTVMGGKYQSFVFHLTLWLPLFAVTVICLIIGLTG